MKSVIVAIIMLTFFTEGHAQFGDLQNFYPLQAGNTWYYKMVDQWYQTYYHKATIISDTIINGNRYFMKKEFFNTITFVRFDTTCGNLLVYSATGGCNGYSNDLIIDSIASSVGDDVNCWNYAIYNRRCELISNETVFGSNVAIRQFRFDGLNSGRNKYAYGFGRVYSCGGDPTPCQSSTYTIGCRINGIVYGDTNLVGIESHESAVIQDFERVSNFPNPFNPSTVVKFTLSEQQYVVMEIYDVSGNRVDVPINKNFVAGTHEIIWNAANHPAGIYFCRLTAGDSERSLKLLYIK
jgi:hypothetical protein